MQPAPISPALPSIIRRPGSAGRALVHRFVRLAAAGGTAAIALLFGTNSLQDAVANGDTRTISIYQTHTKENVTVTFRRNGSYDREALKKLNWILRDWRRDEPTEMDPKLFEVAWAVHREVGSKEPIHVVSAYRSPATNSMLRRRSRAVAEHSQHMLGKAMDFYLPDADMGQVRAIGMRLQRGGVGYYPNAFNPFVHLDAGSVRSWPRMTRDQLASLFPDGKTVHLPRDGKPLPGYEVAKAEILAAGGAVAGVAYADAGEQTPTGGGRSFWAFLFGGADEEEDTELARPTSRPGRGNTIRTASAPVSGPVGGNDRDDARAFFLREQANADAREAPPAATVASAAPAPAPAPAPTVATAAPVEPAAIPTPSPRPPELARVAAVDPNAGLTRDGRQNPAGPQLAWQTGPDSLGSPAGGLLVAGIPEPPRRPDTVTGATTSTDLTIAALAAAAAAQPGLPEPPRRPAELVALAETGLLARTPETGALAALSYAAVDHPAPPLRPGDAARAVASAANAEAAAAIRQPVAAAIVPPAPSVAAIAERQPSERLEHGELKRLFDQVAMAQPAKAGASSPGQTVVAMAKTKPAPVVGPMPHAPLRAVVSSFGAPSDLSTDRFTGPAVKPLNTANFTPSR